MSEDVVDLFSLAEGCKRVDQVSISENGASVLVPGFLSLH